MFHTLMLSVYLICYNVSHPPPHCSVNTPALWIVLSVGRATSLGTN